MAEHLPHSHEHEKQPHAGEALDHPKHEHKVKKSAESYEQDRQKAIEQAQQVIEKEATKQELPVEKQHEAPKQLFVNQELKAMSFQRVLTRTRKKLSKPERTLSGVIHQPVVDGLSRAGEKTIARPSGLLAGGICALLGSTIMLYMARHYGFRYNLFIFIVLFVGGFFLGLLLELVFRLGRHSE